MNGMSMLECATIHTNQHPNNVSNPCDTIQFGHQINTGENVGSRKHWIHRQLQFEYGISFRLQAHDEQNRYQNNYECNQNGNGPFERQSKHIVFNQLDENNQHFAQNACKSFRIHYLMPER